jgi:hypothetical protein
VKFILDASAAVFYSSPEGLAALSKIGIIVVPVTWRIEIASATPGNPRKRPLASGCPPCARPIGCHIAWAKIVASRNHEGS